MASVGLEIKTGQMLRLSCRIIDEWATGRARDDIYGRLPILARLGGGLASLHRCRLEHGCMQRNTPAGGTLHAAKDPNLSSLGVVCLSLSFDVKLPPFPFLFLN